MGWTVKGWSFIACDRGHGYSRKPEDFETDTQIHRSFLEMTPPPPIEFSFCESSLHLIVVEIACVQTPPK